MNRITNILLLTLTLLMAGCEGHQGFDPLQDPNALGGSYIFFDAGVTATKGALVEGTTLPAVANTAFGVFGYRPDLTTPVFSSNVERIYWDTYATPACFNYDNLALWHSNNHYFYAYYPYANNPGVFTIPTESPSVNNPPYINYTQPTDIASMVDVMTAYNSLSSATNGGTVSLTFDHRLFALSVKLQSESESESPLIITSASLTFKNMISKANMYFDGDVETVQTKEQSYTFITQETTLASKGKLVFVSADNPFLLVPDPENPLQLTFAMTFVNAWKEVTTFSLPFTFNGDNSLLAGNKYGLTITRKDGNGTAVEFEPSLTNIEAESLDWQNKVNTDHEFE